MGEAFTRGGASAPVNIAYSGVYQWWYTIGMRTNVDLYNGSLFLLFVAGLFLFAGWLHLQPTFAPAVSWFKNAESRMNHHLFWTLRSKFTCLDWTPCTRCNSSFTRRNSSLGYLLNNFTSPSWTCTVLYRT